MQRGSQIGFFGIRDFLYLKLGIRDYTSKIGASLGIESMLGRWDGKNNPRDYGITRNFGSGYGMKYPIGDRTFCKQWNPEVTRAERERERRLPQLKGIFNIFTKIGFTNAQLCLLACMEARLGSFDLGMDILAT